MESDYKRREHLQDYIDKLFERLDFWTDEYDDDHVCAMICDELTEMAEYVTPEIARRSGYYV